MILKALGVVACMAALDFVWARYTFAMSKKQPFKAGGYASGIILLSGLTAIGYVSDHWMLLPAMAGAFLGTVLAVKLEKKD